MVTKVIDTSSSEDEPLMTKQMKMKKDTNLQETRRSSKKQVSDNDDDDSNYSEDEIKIEKKKPEIHTNVNSTVSSISTSSDSESDSDIPISSLPKINIEQTPRREDEKEPKNISDSSDSDVPLKPSSEDGRRKDKNQVSDKKKSKTHKNIKSIVSSVSSSSDSDCDVSSILSPKINKKQKIGLRNEKEAKNTSGSSDSDVPLKQPSENGRQGENQGRKKSGSDVNLKQCSVVVLKENLNEISSGKRKKVSSSDESESDDAKPLLKKKKLNTSSEMNSTNKSSKVVKDKANANKEDDEASLSSSSEDEETVTNVKKKQKKIVKSKKKKRSPSKDHESEDESDSSDNEEDVKKTKNKVEKKDSVKLKNLKRYVMACGYKIMNYKKYFDGLRSMKAKEEKLLSLLEDLGVKGRPTLKQCTKVKKRREEEREVAELDISNVIMGDGRTRSSRNSTGSKDKESKSATSKRKYDFGGLLDFIEPEDNKGLSDKEENEMDSKKMETKKQKVLSSGEDTEGSKDDSEDDDACVSAEEEDENFTKMKTKKKKILLSDEDE